MEDYIYKKILKTQPVDWVLISLYCEMHGTTPSNKYQDLQGTAFDALCYIGGFDGLDWRESPSTKVGA